MPKNDCLVDMYCKHKGCIQPDNRWISQSNCTCLGCLQRSEVKECEHSGDPYNTDLECMMLK